MKRFQSQSFLSLLFISVVFGFVSCAKTKEKPALTDEEHAMVVADEISNHNIKGFAEDAHGHLWMATFRGLNKFDGNKFYQYFCTDDSTGLPDNNVTGVFCDRNKRIWVSTVNGVCRYTDKNTFERIAMDDKNLNVVQLLITPNNRIIIYTIGSLLEYDARKNRFVKRLGNLDPQHNFMGRVIIDRHNSVWIQNLNCLRRYEGKRLSLADSIAMPKGFSPTYALKMHQMRLQGALFSAMIGYIVSTHIIKVDCLSALLKMAFSIMIRHQRRYFLPKNRASRSTNPISKLHKCTQIPRITCGWDLPIKVIVSSISTIKFSIPTTFWSKQWAINRC